MSSLKGLKAKHKPKAVTFNATVFSRHPSNKKLSKNMVVKGITFKKPVTIRFGSTTPNSPFFDKHVGIEVNKVEGVINSSDKFRMKALFKRNEVITAPAFMYTNQGFFMVSNDVKNPISPDAADFNEMKGPFVGKIKKGSQGVGMVLLDDVEELKDFCANFNEYKKYPELEIADKEIAISGYIFEQYIPYSREYRIHVSKNKMIYTNRKMLKKDTPDELRYFRNDKNSNWFLEENQEFDKPVNWDKIVAESQKALNAVGLDVGAVDVKVQGSVYKGKKRKDPKFFIIEINSAPSFGDGTMNAYLNVIEEVVNQI
jgi:hypothetical protein